MKRLFTMLLCLLLCGACYVEAQNYKQPLNDWIKRYEVAFPDIGRLRVLDVKVNSNTKRIGVYCSANFQNIPFRMPLIEQMWQEIDSVVAPTYKDYKVNLYADKVNVLDLVPNYYREQLDKERLSRTKKRQEPFVVSTSRPYDIASGLDQRNIALWASHGWYYDQRSDRWRWQRARLFQTVEDKLPMAFVLPYLVPMLENAGAHVLMPRERDLQLHEVIVDNDSSSYGSIYREEGALNEIRQGGSAGFGMHRTIYVENENPFNEGTFRQVKGSREEEVRFEWIPDIPESGYYQVSIAFRSKERSCTDATYTVYYAGGERRFKVNQTMGGGTWIYLGNFYFEKGLHADHGKVVLSNASDDGNCTIIADAVRFGGGMGNVGRRPATETEVTTAKRKRPGRDARLLSPYLRSDYQVSERPRYLEGARYWLQWAGVPDSIYNYSYGLNDYTDDFASRGGWVNWLNGGSVYAPDSAGLAIPIDLAFAFHTDANTRMDGVVGSLGIYTTDSGDKKLGEQFPDKQSRYASRDLTDLVLNSIVDDVRSTYNPHWAYRGMWNKNYAETRRPEVPSMILELLSHQNYEDMQYALDPRFRFVVSRAIYKGMLRFVATQHGLSYVVQPLPVSHVRAQLVGDSVQIAWQAVKDSLEPTAVPTGYVVYSRRGDGGFDQGQYTSATSLTLPLPADVAMSYRVEAVNSGGASMPSEVVSAMRNSSDNGVVLIVNGFTRIAPPEGFMENGIGGFPQWLDPGVADGYDMSYVGNQYLFDSREPWLDDDSPGWGGSYGNCETMLVKGNSFDNIYVHGKAIGAAGYSYASSSVAAVEEGLVEMSGYPIVDLILGEQKSTPILRDSSRWEFKTFSIHLQAKLRGYAQSGGAILVSGAHVGSDLWQGGESSKSDQRFAQEVLKYKWRTNHASRSGEVKGVYAPNLYLKGDYTFATMPNDSVNAVPMSDGVEPADKGAYTIMRYKENNMSAGVGYQGNYRSVVLGFPIESISDEATREKLMWHLLQLLDKRR